ncbi:AMP-binding protein [Mangrovibacterium lignilyticum]|uniref:AMP-binding protein n=1 Tax=Mangrovibacterium lignilyticum TaxID=2668052 RepID=UPI0013D6B781|nr:AMP-binding protein [Mangrovibacterium lignilyticum]
MRNHSPIIIRFVKSLLFIVRKILSLRYNVTVKGGEILENSSSVFILPNHQALIDPILLMCHIHRNSKAIPVIISNYYDIPVLKSIFKMWGAIRVSNLESGSRNVKVLNEVSRSVLKGFNRGENILLYPSGQLAGKGYERIFNKQSAHKIASRVPDNVKIVGVRMTGLWGSMWSKAWTGESPNFSVQLLKGMFYILANLIFFLPKRKVVFEFEDLTSAAKQKAREGRNEFNSYLEEFYNLHGEEQAVFLKHFFFMPQLKKEPPSQIDQSEEEIQSAALPTDDEIIQPGLLEKVKGIVAIVIGADPEEITLDSYLSHDLGADSLNLVEIMSEIENQFDTFSTPQINDIKTIGDLCLVAMGQFTSEADLKPSYLEKSLSKTGNIQVDPEKNILWQFLDTFTSNPKDYFSYDAMLGCTNRKNFMLKAAVVSKIIKKRVNGPRVGIMLPALQSTTTLIIASYMAGKIPVMLNWTVGKKVLEHCMKTADVDVILSAGTFIRRIEEQLPESVINKLVLLEKEVPRAGIITKLKGLITAKFPRSFLPYKQLNETAVVLFTSGSEAMPKAVPLTHKNIVSDLHGVFSSLQIENNLTFLGFLPPFHSFGFTVLSVLPLVSGVKVAYTPNPTDAREVLKILKHTKANILLGTPGFLKLMMGRGTSYFFKSVRYVITGAEAMPPVLKELFDQLTTNALLLEGYGITECAPVLTINPLEKQKLNSVGKFIQDVEGLIVDLDTGKPCRTGEPGMIYARGKNVFHGYLGEGGTSPFEQIGGKTWYKTGDLGYLDEEGYLFITGRLKRFIKIAGEMISLPFIEKILLEKYGEEEQQVLAVEGSDTITPPQVVLFTIRPFDLDQVNSYLMKNGVAPIARIKRIIQTDEIPLLGTGKTDYKVLRKMIES